MGISGLPVGENNTIGVSRSRKLVFFRFVAKMGPFKALATEVVSHFKGDAPSLKGVQSH